MNLHSLLKEIGIVCPFEDSFVSCVTDAPERMKKNGVFVCIGGKNFDGHSFAEKALEMGASAVICEKELGLPKCILVRDTRKAYSFLCNAFFSYPADKLKLIGITGTNGKTTTSIYLKHFLEADSYKCGLIGTLGNSVDGELSQTGYTTPSGDILFSSLAQMAQSGCEYCIMEVSSQALAQSRVEALNFEIGIFTNIGNDHLDYHGTLDRYVKDKSRLCVLSKKTLLNNDDAYCDVFVHAAENKRCLTYSSKVNFSDYMAKNIRLSNNKTSYIMLTPKGIVNMDIPCPGEFSVYNSLAAASCAVELGLELDVIEKAAVNLPRIKGRMQMIQSQLCTVCIDFAHTPTALEGVLKTLGSICSGKIITVFGCGGNRDKTKRPEMGSIAATFSDSLIVTSDNPRNEDANEIIKDIVKGIKKGSCPYFCEPDREKAIKLALNKAQKNDIVLIAGKGHEEYQIIGSEQVFFSDEKCVKDILGLY